MCLLYSPLAMESPYVNFCLPYLCDYLDQWDPARPCSVVIVVSLLMALMNDQVKCVLVRHWISQDIVLSKVAAYNVRLSKA